MCLWVDELRSISGLICSFVIVKLFEYNLLKYILTKYIMCVKFVVVNVKIGARMKKVHIKPKVAGDVGVLVMKANYRAEKYIEDITGLQISI